MKNILLVDDHPLVRYSYKNILQNSSLFKNAYFHEASNISEAFSIIKKITIQIAIIDLNLNSENGIHLVQNIKIKQPSCKIVVVSFYENIQILWLLKHLNINAYLPKTTSIDQIVEVCQHVEQSNVFIAPSEYLNLLESYNNEDIQYFLENIQILSNTEKQILKLRIRKFKNNEIAEFMDLKLKTIENNINKISDKCIPKNHTLRDFIEKNEEVLNFLVTFIFT